VDGYSAADGSCLHLLIRGTYHVAAQSTDCPADKVCITREAAERLCTTATRVKADEIAIAGYKQAIDDLKAEINKVRVEFAAVSGENTALKQSAVRTDAIIDVLLKNVRPKKIGLDQFLNEESPFPRPC
jgi:hypothetical protein